MEDKLKITLIQSDLYWEEIEANLASFEEKIWDNEPVGDVIVLPEMFTTGFTMEPQKVSEPMNSKTFRWMRQMSRQTGSLMIGSYVIKEDKSYYNRLFAVYPDGDFKTCDKRHLFIGGEDKYYQGGEKRVIIEWKGWKLFPLVCYDLRFPVWCRNSPSADNLHEFDATIFIANWPAARVYAWSTLLKARAIENQAYCIGVNRIGKGGNQLDYTGQSAAYDFLGHEMAALEDKEIAETVELDREKLTEFREKFPFQKDADGFDIH